MITFGVVDSSADYIYRRGAYAIVFDDAKERIAVVREREGHYLPGGGIEGGESEIECLHRELMEEAGWEIRVGTKIGTAQQYFFGPLTQIHYLCEGHFYLAKRANDLQHPPQSGSEASWMSIAEAKGRLYFEYQAWAVEQAVRFITRT